MPKDEPQRYLPVAELRERALAKREKILGATAKKKLAEHQADRDSLLGARATDKEDLFGLVDQEPTRKALEEEDQYLQF